MLILQCGQHLFHLYHPPPPKKKPRKNMQNFKTDFFYINWAFIVTYTCQLLRTFWDGWVRNSYIKQPRLPYSLYPSCPVNGDAYHGSKLYLLHSFFKINILLIKCIVMALYMHHCVNFLERGQKLLLILYLMGFFGFDHSCIDYKTSLKSKEILVLLAASK